MRRWRDMSAEELTQVLCDLTPPLCRMLSDGAVQRALEEMLRGELGQMDVLAGWAKVLEKLLPLLLRQHRADVMAAAAALLGWTPDEVASRPACEVLGMLQACWMEELPAFARLCRAWGQDAMLLTVSSAGHPGNPEVLKARLRQMVRQELREEAQTGMLWRMAARAGEVHGVPEEMPEEMRMPRPEGAGMSAEGVRQLLLRRLQELPEAQERAKEDESA